MFREAASRIGQSHWAVRCRDLRVAAPVARLIVSSSSPVSDTAPSLVARKLPKPSSPWLAMCTLHRFRHRAGKMELHHGELSPSMVPGRFLAHP